MADLTKKELEDLLDEVQEVLEAAYMPESSREELAEAIGKALDLIEPQEEEEVEVEEEGEEGPEED